MQVKRPPPLLSNPMPGTPCTFHPFLPCGLTQPIHTSKPCHEGLVDVISKPRYRLSFYRKGAAGSSCHTLDRSAVQSKRLLRQVRGRATPA